MRQCEDGIELIECKAGQTAHPQSVGSLDRIGKLLGDQVVRKRLIYGGEQSLDLRGVRILPWREIDGS